jgi:hypothetical protein
VEVRVLDEPRLPARLLAYLRAGPDLEHRAAVLADAGVALALRATTAGLSVEEHAALLNAARGSVVATLRAQSASAVVVQALSKAGIPHVALKGAALAEGWQRGWATGEARTYGDADFLVAGSDVAAAVASLARDAPVPSGPASGGQVTVPLTHTTALDLHWTIVNDQAWVQRFGLETEKVLGQYTRWQGVRGQLDPEFTLVHTTVHALLSDLSRPAALFDIDGCVRDPAMDWERFVFVVRHHSLQLPVAAALARTTYWLDSPVPRVVFSSLGPRSPWLWLCRAVQRRDPAKYLASGWSGGELYRLTRATTVESCARLVRSLPLEIRTQRRLRRVA